MMDTVRDFSPTQAHKLTRTTPTHTHRDNDDNDKEEQEELVAAANVVAWFVKSELLLRFLSLLPPSFIDTERGQGGCAHLYTYAAPPPPLLHICFTLLHAHRDGDTAS